MPGPVHPGPGRVLMAMTEAEAALWKAFKAVLREQAGGPVQSTAQRALQKAEVTAAHQVANPVVPVAACRAQGRGDLVCVKASGHPRQHRYGKPPPPERVVPVRAWVKETSFQKVSLGGRRFTIEVGYPCKVENARGMWKVIGIERHTETGQVNVEVTQDRTGHSRTFTSDKVIYKRPVKVKVPA